jgi:transcriptional regulator with XRE-family HTH domain
MSYIEITNDKIYLGLELKERRIRMNVTKSRIKVLSGLDYNTIRSIETGKTEYTIDSLLLYLNAMKKIKDLKDLKLNKNTEMYIVFNDISVFEKKDNNLQF